jgi:hypothetical protein
VSFRSCARQIEPSSALQTHYLHFQFLRESGIPPIIADVVAWPEKKSAPANSHSRFGYETSNPSIPSALTAKTSVSLAAFDPADQLIDCLISIYARLSSASPPHPNPLIDGEASHCTPGVSSLGRPVPSPRQVPSISRPERASGRVLGLTPPRTGLDCTFTGEKAISETFA